MYCQAQPFIETDRRSLSRGQGLEDIEFHRADNAVIRFRVSADSEQRAQYKGRQWKQMRRRSRCVCDPSDQFRRRNLLFVCHQENIESDIVCVFRGCSNNPADDPPLS